MKRRKIVTAGNLPKWVIDEFFSNFEIVVVKDFSRSALLSCLDDEVTGIMARGASQIDRKVIQAAPNLKVIARTGVGFNNIDVKTASLRNIPVLYTPHALSRAVAEHTLSLILAAAKDLRGWHERVLKGAWQERYHRHNVELKNATVGIVGLGRIGRQMRRLLQPFDVNLLVNDPYLKPSDFSQESFSLVSLEELLESSDIVTLHLPLNQETKGLINSSNIDRFKPGAIFVNAARGELVENYDILYAALEDGRLGFVALDTLIVEPPDLSHPIFYHARVLLSAHVGTRTLAAQERIFRTLGEDMKAVLEGGQPRRENVVNPEVMG